MNDKNKNVIDMDSMKIVTESMQVGIESMKMTTASQRSSQPNTTNTIQVKPDFTPPSQSSAKKDT